MADCRESLRRIPQVRICHCYREVNKCVDGLAWRGVHQAQDFVLFSEPPSNVYLLLNLDHVGMVYERWVPFGGG